MHCLAAHAKNSGFKLPSSIVVHGFLNPGAENANQGTFIGKEYLQKVNHPQAPEYLRFLPYKTVPNTADIDLSPDEFISRINTTLTWKSPS